MVFALYLLVLGVGLTVAPNALLSLFGIPETTEVWVRVVGVLVLILALYFAVGARANLVPFFRATVYGRCLVLVFFVVFVLLDLAPPVLILFGVVDATAAAWTALALRRTGTV